MNLSLPRTIKSLAVNALLIPERRQYGVTYNPFSDKVTQGPYPVYAELRQRSPVQMTLRLPTEHPAFRYGIVLRGLTTLPLGANIYGLFASGPVINSSVEATFPRWQAKLVKNTRCRVSKSTAPQPRSGIPDAAVTSLNI